MATGHAGYDDRIPDWVLAITPLVLILVTALIAYGVYTAVDLDWLAVSGNAEVLLVLAGIGFIAGILPVAIGMAWYPFFRRLRAHWIHVVLAFSAGILAYIAVEMALAAGGYATETATPSVSATVAVFAALATIGAMELFGRWRRRTTDNVGNNSLTIAYLVAIGLGLHSIGEGLAIGTAFVAQDLALVLLFTIGFILHNVTEGPVVVAALSRERERPPLYHFAALGILAGGGVIIGGWIGSFAYSPFIATLFFGIACGAIIQVTWEMFDLVRTEAQDLRHWHLPLAFFVGVALLFILEEVLIEAALGISM